MEKVLLILILLIIFIQDLKMRAVYCFLFPILLGGSIWYNIQNISMQSLTWNLAFIVFALSMLTVYISVKQRKLTAIWNGFFSIGDILFLIAIIPLLPFHTYLMYFTIGTICSLIFHAIAMLFFRDNKTVPFAGYMALVLIGFLAFDTSINQLIQASF